jgi:hypothetical protein
MFLAQEIIEDLGAAREKFRENATALGREESEGDKS